MVVLWDVAPCSVLELTDVSEVLTAPSYPYQTTRRSIPEDSNLLDAKRISSVGYVWWIVTAGRVCVARASGGLLNKLQRIFGLYGSEQFLGQVFSIEFFQNMALWC
jgi:hypothetical protein